jgi:hypothetical protein
LLLQITIGRNNLKINNQSFLKNQARLLSQIIEQNFSEESIREIAWKSGFIKRSRKLSALHFLNALMFSCTSQAETSLPDITADLSQQFSIEISKEGLHKKFTPQAVAFLKAMIAFHLSEQLSLQTDSSLKKYFKAINIKDSSKFSLPSTYNGAYPGYGNFDQIQGLMNIQYEYDLLSGNWKTLELTTIKRNDQQDSKESIECISKGELYIRDLGYVTATYLKAIIHKEAFFLNRLPPQVTVYVADSEKIDWARIDRKLKKMKANALDIDVQIYEKEQIPCRMVVERVDNNIYRKRIKQAENTAKRHGVGLTKQHRARCRYNIFITNVERDILPLEKIRKSYYLRWQIELVFKTWKTTVEINKLKKVKKERLECQLLAKLLWTLLNWRLFQCCNHHVRTKSKNMGVSVLKFFKRSLVFSDTLRLVILKKLPLHLWLDQVFLPLIRNTACEAPSGKRTHYQTLDDLFCLS